MMDASEFGDAAAMLYEAAAIPEMWPAAIARLSQLAGCEGGLLFSHSPHGTNWMSSDSIRPLVQRFIDDGWMQRNTRMQGLLAHCGTGFVGDHDVFIDAEMAEMPVYRDFLVPNGFGWAAATHVRSATGDNIILSLERRYDRGPIGGREIALLDGIRPHLARAAVLAAKLHMQRAQASLDSFEQAGSPAALIGGTGNVMAMNPRFAALQGPIIIRARDKIALDDKRADALLQQALANLAQDRLGDTRSIPVPGKDQHAACIIHVLPIRRQARDIFSRAQAMLVVTTSDRELMIEASLLCELYDLTRAEAAVANRILDGLSVNEIAVAHRVSRETVRSQLKKVLAKTACQSQADFIRSLAPLAKRPAASSGSTGAPPAG